MPEFKVKAKKIQYAAIKAKKIQYAAIDEAIRTAQFIRNKCIRLWSDR